MVVTSVQIKTVKIQKHLYCPVFTQKSHKTTPFYGFFLFLMLAAVFHFIKMRVIKFVLFINSQ